MKPQNSSRLNRLLRSLYFFLDRLQVSRSERLAVSFMALVLVALSLLNVFTRQRPVYDPLEYEQMEQLFREKTERARQQRLSLLARYEGNSVGGISGVETDPSGTAADPILNDNSESSFILQPAVGPGDTVAATEDSLETAGNTGRVSGVHPDSTAIDSATSGLKVNINTATAEMLQELPGIGPTYSRRIIRWRVQNGPFTSREQLLEINGIGPVRLRRISPLIVF